MKFTVSGTMAGYPVTISWEDGALSGDDWLVSLVEHAAVIHNGTAVGPPTGPVTMCNHLSSGLSTLVLIKLAGVHIKSVTGDQPKIPRIPHDAIG